MGTLDGILQEELKRLAAAEKSYVREVKKLPKGSIQVKRIKGIAYPYLVIRKGKKVVSEYLGQRSERELEELKQAISQRKKYERHLKEVKYNLKRISKMTRGKRRKAI